MILYIISALLASLLVLPFTLRRSCLYLWADVRYATNMLRTSLTMLSWYRRKPLRFFVVDRFLEQRIQTNRSLCSREKLSPSTRPTGWAAEWPTICRLSPATELETHGSRTWLALAGLDSPVAFINHNIRSKALLNCPNCVEARVLTAAAGTDACKEGMTQTMYTRNADSFSSWT